MEILSHRDLSFAHVFGVWKKCPREIVNIFDFGQKVMDFGFCQIFLKRVRIFQKIHRIRTAEIESVRLRYFLSNMVKGGGREGGLKLVCAKKKHKIGHGILPERYIYIL